MNYIYEDLFKMKFQHIFNILIKISRYKFLMKIYCCKYQAVKFYFKNISNNLLFLQTKNQKSF
jgi:hypothetical protein